MQTQRRVERQAKAVAAVPGFVVEFRVGPDAQGPQKCLVCQRPFTRGEAWKRYSSPPDSKLGSYIIGIHDCCS